LVHFLQSKVLKLEFWYGQWLKAIVYQLSIFMLSESGITENSSLRE